MIGWMTRHILPHLSGVPHLHVTGPKLKTLLQSRYSPLRQKFEILHLLERFSYDLEMKAREQNRNDKRTEIERFDWFIERTNKRVWLFIG